MRKPSTSVTTTTRTSTFPAVAAARPHAVSSVASSGSATGTESFTYDAAGNMTKRSTSTTAGKVYEWDREGRVKSVADLATASKKIEYLYDADGNRLIERDSTGTTATITLNVGASQIKVNDGTTPALNTSTTRTYTLGDEAVATRTASGVRLMATDDQGTPLVTVNPNNLTYVKRRLSPFGEQLQAPASPGWPSNKGFLNKTTDTWAGTSHLEAREYDTRDGRFISVDPIADFFDPQQINGYAYANNNPITMTDSDGLRTECGGCGGDWNSPEAVKFNYNGTKASGRKAGNTRYSERKHPNFGAAKRFTSARLQRVREGRAMAARIGIEADTLLGVAGATYASMSADPVSVGLQTRRNFKTAVWGVWLLQNPMDIEARNELARAFNGFYPRHRAQTAWSRRTSGVGKWASRALTPVGLSISFAVSYSEQRRMDAGRPDIGGLEGFARAVARGAVVTTANATGSGVVAAAGAAPAAAACPATACVSVGALIVSSLGAGYVAGEVADSAVDEVLNR